MYTLFFYAPLEEQQKLLEHHYDRWIGQHGNFIAWMAPTYFHLKKAGFNCEIVTQLPHEGIVLAEWDTLGNTSHYLGKALLICLKSDRDYYPGAHLHVVHNRFDFEQQQHSLWHPYFMLHWPMPEIIPRDKERQCLVENVAYIGSRSQLAKEFTSQEWRESLADLGCQWLPIFDPQKWHDYRQIDLIVAARNFQKKDFLHKGAIKLFNSWCAGVPALLPPETAFLDERKTDLDFLIIDSLEDALQGVKKLKENPEIYSAMVNNSQERAKNITTEKTLEKWLDFINQIVFPTYEKWLKMSDNQRKILFARRFMKLKIERMQERIEKITQRGYLI